QAIDEIKTTDKSSLYEYMDNPIVVFIDYSQIEASYEKLVSDIFEYQQSNDIKESLMFEITDINPTYTIYLNKFSSGRLNFNAKTIINYNSDFEKLSEDVYKYQKKGQEVIFCLSKESQITQIKKLIPGAKIIQQKINNGFIIDKYVVIGENDIEETHHHPINYKNNYRIGKKIKDFNQLKTGDYVVHLTHGIGIYQGITTLTVRGAQKDFLKIAYEGKDKIYVPVEKITTIYKYTDSEGIAPKINKLGSVSWEKTRKYVEKKVQDISADLIRLYKERISIKGKIYKDYPEEEQFASSFQYELTKDQRKTISEINEDLKRGVPMDRLLCGDVGFGKTEVAMRAIFKAILNNNQVLYLCPTTILSKQQYLVAKERFKDWPIEIEILNRHVTGKKAKEILDGLKSGKIDLVVGTHRLLSDDIVCKNLGLLVVDEEQRFGVTHKEKIKNYKKDVNVLTLSATPIPRTLKMAMSGLRDLSIIDTPPVNRYPVQTYVVLEDDFVIRDAIYKELSRGGQVFILYNYVETIEKYASHIQNLIPEARINFAHGQMNKIELDKIMSDFIDQKHDILICTTIIESGIDIPNVNTLLVHDADKFGLSQLYQIRGRVGRSNKIAYAYLLYAKNKILNEIAIKRLETIKEFTELGSGYRIAMRDLSIRGAGDIFGASQAGFVDSVGITLYMKMIEDEVKRQQGIEVIEDEDVKALINVTTHISDDYVSDEDIKIEIHQKINEIDSLESLLKIKEELEDRFGKVSNDLIVYMYEEWFEKIAKKHNITRVIQTERSIEIELPEKVSKEIKGDKLLMESLALTRSFNIKCVNNRIIIQLFYKNLEKHFIFYIVSLLEKIL
ncbi:MAG: transcription-repair coupling factor, partial [Bacilli bacterium]|nr:transcription-repair coupling factor [Bacilli bacterium]